MRKVILKIHMSLDGYISTGKDDDMKWIFKSYGQDLENWEVDLLWKAGIHIMGRKLYEEMAAYWPNSTEVYARPMNEIPKIVFSKTLKHSDWQGTSIFSGDIARKINDLKLEDGKDILVHGGANFIQSLTKLKLIDEYLLIVHPLFLSKGLPLFNERINLKLFNIKSFPAGTVLLNYNLNERSM